MPEKLHRNPILPLPLRHFTNIALDRGALTEAGAFCFAAVKIAICSGASG